MEAAHSNSRTGFDSAVPRWKHTQVIKTVLGVVHVLNRRLRRWFGHIGVGIFGRCRRLLRLGRHDARKYSTEQPNTGRKPAEQSTDGGERRVVAAAFFPLNTMAGGGFRTVTI